MTIIIYISKEDPASYNIKERLLDKTEWTVEGVFRDGEVFKNDKYLMVVGDRHIDQNGLDKELRENGIDADCIVFPSRHSSDNGDKLLSIHTPGNLGDEASVGGNPREISCSEPNRIKIALNTLKQLSKKTDYKTSLEATHHGPSNIEIPTLFIEIGSGEDEWRDPVAGEIVAETILNIRDVEKPPINGVSVGGGHYAPEQTRLLLETNIGLGHIMPDYAFDPEMLELMIKKTPGCRFIHLCGDKIDRNQVSMFEIPVYREGEIRDLEPIDPDYWDIFIQNASENSKPIYTGKKQYNKFKLVKINQKLINMAQRVDSKPKGFKDCLNSFEIIYYKRKNGTITNKFFVPSKGFKDRIEKLINCAIKTIEQEKPIEVSREDGHIQITVTEKKFNPDKAISLGIEKNKFGVLSGGRELEIEGKTITPAMVHNINKKTINVKYPPKVLDEVGPGLNLN
ncbi:D-aminoacyl-tRNA deacylase involved in ethanol tolerance GEK1 [Methanonatronarchaeum thermophilum]|uniref:D-aminoacyl-tRNA deacylase n=1 Tax=Methanonatronarchaeum thermophilum TaxID=1927129 RepID=A0A1Y3GCB2_9EURY|nr:D-aminoacyl-tRNA deacylase [Methanonatronarchaeum thermophilum]OUJ19091.1 D-aminoacyl-tRNA deacylase involved in ethanol tolerance GEK1 [Methanonatronarchaeum thermophilum]